jgi:hypothetical protein
MAVNLSPIGNGFQFLTTTGLPLNGGLIYTYQAGSTTPLTTYSDINGSIANTNPIVLGTDGRPQGEIWLTYGFNYKFVLQTSTGSTIQTYDNLYGIIGTTAATGTTIPAGLISLWYGSIGSIPSGWYLCDGSNGTPDLRDRFIVGAGSTYSVAATGGSTTHTLTTSEMPSHTHTATVTDPGHVHSIAGSISATGSGGNALIIGSGLFSASAVTGITVTNSATGSGTAFNILNPYYALAYIMKS